MTERSEESKYIKCSNCWCKYINDEEQIKQDFGYNRLENRYKTCVKCRGISREYKKVYIEKRTELWKLWSINFRSSPILFKML